MLLVCVIKYYFYAKAQCPLMWFLYQYDSFCVLFCFFQIQITIVFLNPTKQLVETLVKNNTNHGVHLPTYICALKQVICSPFLFSFSSHTVSQSRWLPFS